MNSAELNILSYKDNCDKSLDVRGAMCTVCEFSPRNAMDIPPIVKKSFDS